MTPDNEATEQEAQEEVVSESELKAKTFQDNPDNFVHVDDCLVVIEAKRNEDGRITHYRMKASIETEDEAHIAKGRCQMIVDSTLVALMRKKASEKQIVAPGNGQFMPGLRKFLNK